MGALTTPPTATDRSRPNRRRLTYVVAAIAFVAAACGSDTTTSEPDQAIPDLDQINAELDAIEFESEPIDGVAVLGNASLAESVDAGSAEQANDSVTEPDAEELDPQGDPDDVDLDDVEFIEPCPEDGPCTEIDEGPAPTEPPAFVPTAEWAPFCTVLAAIDERPLPSDPIEQVQVVDRWFALLEPHLPGAIIADFGVLDALLDEAVSAGSLDLLEAPDDAADDAAERIGDAVDANCSGR